MYKKLTQSELLLYVHGAAAFQLLHAGCTLKVFEALHRQPRLTLQDIARKTRLSFEPARTLVFGLISLKLLQKQKDRYRNNIVIEKLFLKNEWQMFKSLVLIQAYIMYPGQIDYVDSLKKSANVGVRRFPGKGKTIYERLDADSKLKKTFYDYMEAYSDYANPHLLQNVDFSKDKSVLDVGGGGGGNAIAIAKNFPNIHIVLLDLLVAASLAKAKVRQHRLSDRITFHAADMFKDDFPKNQDVILFIHQLVIWSKKENELLLRKAYQSLTKGGRVIIFSSIADDTEDGPLMAALDTVYFRSVAAGNGMIYPWKDYNLLLRRIGFHKIKKIRCKTWTPHGIIIGYK